MDGGPLCQDKAANSIRGFILAFTILSRLTPKYLLNDTLQEENILFLHANGLLLSSAMSRMCILHGLCKNILVNSKYVYEPSVSAVKMIIANEQFRSTG